jgi:hypothetical protein
MHPAAVRACIDAVVLREGTANAGRALRACEYALRHRAGPLGLSPQSLAALIASAETGDAGRREVGLQREITSRPLRPDVAGQGTPRLPDARGVQVYLRRECVGGERTPTTTQVPFSLHTENARFSGYSFLFSRVDFIISAAAVRGTRLIAPIERSLPRPLRNTRHCSVRHNQQRSFALPLVGSYLE